MPPAAWLLLAIFGLAALQSAVGLVLHRPGRVGENVFSTLEADATHLLMNGVMAVMVTPAYTAAVRSGATILLGMAAFGVALALVRHRPGARSTGPLTFRAYAVAAAYHVLMLAAMIYALWVMAPNMGPMCSPRMAGMDSMPGPPHLHLTLAHALAALFGLDGATGSIAVVTIPRQLLAAESMARADATPALARQVRELRFGFIPHLVMDAGMVWMLCVS